jgi:glycosyltransferase involved in cell wall biosynthesis
MQLALVTETFPPEVNGVAMTLENLRAGLTRRGHDLEIIRPARSLETPHKGIQIGESLHLPMLGCRIPGYPELRLGFPARRFLRKRWAKQKPDWVHVATEGPLGRSAIQAANDLGLPVTSGFHTRFHSYSKHYAGIPLGGLVWRYLRRVHNQTRMTFAPTQELCDELNQKGLRNSRVLGRGVDGKLFSPAHRDADLRQSWGAPDEQTPVILYVGRLAAEKNLKLAVSAFHAFRKNSPQARMVLVGSGPLEATLRKAHPELIFAGVQKGEELTRHYASADWFFFPSLTETYGNVVTEAMTSGLAVLAFDYAAAREHIVDGENGWITPFGDHPLFIEKAAELATVQADQLSAIRTAAATKAKAFSWDGVVDRWLDDLATLGAPIPFRQSTNTTAGHG